MIVASISDGYYLLVTVAGVIFASLTAPLVLQRAADRRHTKDREEDKKERDDNRMIQLEAAAKVEVAAQTLKDNSAEIAATAAAATRDQADQARQAKAQAEEAAALLLASNKAVAEQSAKQMGMLEGIHTLVNSSLTKAMESELSATVRELAMMKEVIELKSAAGLTPTPEAIDAIAATAAKITELKQIIKERINKTQVAEEQINAGTLL